MVYELVMGSLIADRLASVAPVAGMPTTTRPT